MKKIFNIFKFKSLTNFIFLISFYIFSLCLIIKLVFFSTFLYKISINFFAIPLKSSLLKEQILNDYYEIISYITNIKNNFLTLKYFTLSDKANYHFFEVKQVFNYIDLAFTLCLILILIYMLNAIKYNNLSFILNNISNLIIISIILLCTLCIFNFDFVFKTMHNIIFNNDYWLFNPEIDPIINIFPKEFFILCIFFCFLLLFLIVYLLKLLSKYISSNSNLCK